MHILSPETDNCPSWISGWERMTGENDGSKYFMINLHERMLPTSAGVEPATSCSPVGRRIQLSHHGPMILGVGKILNRLHPLKLIWALLFTYPSDPFSHPVTHFSGYCIYPKYWDSYYFLPNLSFTFTTLWADTADDKFMMFFLIFSK